MRRKREWAENFFEKGAELVGGQKPKNFDEYLGYMATPRTYIEGELEILAACEALNVNILIYGIDDRHDTFVKVKAPNHTTQTVGLVHYDAPGLSAHYWYVMLPRHRHLVPR